MQTTNGRPGAGVYPGAVGHSHLQGTGHDAPDLILLPWAVCGQHTRRLTQTVMRHGGSTRRLAWEPLIYCGQVEKLKEEVQA